jgi:hypothetical protein
MECWNDGKLRYSPYHTFDKNAHYSRDSYPVSSPSTGKTKMGVPVKNQNHPFLILPRQGEGN